MQLKHDLRKLSTCLHVSSSVKLRENARASNFHTRRTRARTHVWKGGQRVGARQARRRYA